MSKTKLVGKWTDNMAFKMDMGGHEIIMDALKSTGGSELGPRPKPLLLASLVGCVGVDTMLILNKMKVEIDDLDIEVEADNAEEQPKVYENIHLKLTFYGKDLPEDRIRRSVELSVNKYCPVASMLRKSTPVTCEVVIKER